MPPVLKSIFIFRTLTPNQGVLQSGYSIGCQCQTFFFRQTKIVTSLPPFFKNSSKSVLFLHDYVEKQETNLLVSFI